MPTATQKKQNPVQSEPGKTQPEPSKAAPLAESEPGKTIPLFAYDLGNRWHKFGYGEVTHKIASYRAVIPSFQEISPSHLPSGTHLVEVEGVRTVVGAGAVGYGARPTYQGADGDKWVHAKIFLLAALAECGLSGEVEIKELRTVCPDTQSPEQVSALKSLKGNHQADVDGKPVNLSIAKIAIYDEGQPAWAIASNDGLWRFPQALNGILDLGGGTAIARLITPEGRPVRQTELILTGTYGLAEKIQSFMGGPRCIPEILDSIESGTFQVPSGREFKSVFEHCLPEWIADLRGEMRSRWSAWEGRYGQIAICGGSAPLAQALAQENPRYLLLDNPQSASLRGLLLNG